MSVLPSDIAYYASLLDPAYDGVATLNGAIASTTAATLTINTPTSVFPASGEFGIQVDSEIMWVTQVSGLTFTVIRGFAGSTAATHSSAASVSMPAGGGIDILAKHAFSDIVPGHTANYISSSASDTKVILVLTGRDTSGIIQTETKTLNGQTAVTGTQVWDRFENVRLGAGTTLSAQITAGATSITVPSFANYPASGNYNIQLGKEVMTVTAGQGTTTWTVTRGVGGTTATVHQAGDNIYLLPVGDVAVYDATAIISAHTMQTGSANGVGVSPALAKLQASDGASTTSGQIIVTTSGTGPNQIRTIITAGSLYPIGSPSADVVGVSRNWGTLPDNTTVYSVYNGVQLDLSPNPITEVKRFLWNAASDIPGGSQRIFYQKIFAVNNNTATALTSSTVQDAINAGALPTGALLDLATATAVNDTVSWVNRQTVPGSGYGSFATQPLATAYGANSGNLASGAAPNTANSQGIVLRLTLPAGTATYKGNADLRTLGTTT